MGGECPQLKKWNAQYVEANGWKIKRVRCDNAGEHSSTAFDEFMTQIAAKKEFTNV